MYCRAMPVLIDRDAWPWSAGHATRCTDTEVITPFRHSGTTFITSLTTLLNRLRARKRDRRV
jgi:hypothetical protein